MAHDSNTGRGPSRKWTVRIDLLLGLLVATATAASAQPGLTGTWTADSVGWTVVLTVDGSDLTGLVSHCATVFESRTEIFDAHIAENTITFKCTSPDRDRTISFTGRLSDSAIVFTWERHVREGGIDNSDVDKIFGGSAPRQFTARRVPDGDLARAANETRGMEFAAAINVPEKNVKTEGLLFVPRRVSRVRTIIVVIRYGLGGSVYYLPEWRKLSESVDAALMSVRFSNLGPTDGGLNGVNQADGGGDALFGVLRRLSQESGHPEAENAPLVVWGHSAAGGVASILAGLHPERTLAFVRYHSGPVGGEFGIVSKIPSLLLSGGRDTTSPSQVAEALWKKGRAIGAPWTFAVEPEATHGEDKDVAKASDFMIRWITAVVRQRLPEGATLRVATDSSGWMGDNRTGEIASYSTFVGAKPESSWLPDEQSAQAWRELRGAGK